jgi:SlyX protein
VEDTELMSTVQTDIEQLQMKMAFQEDTIESLNQALILQQKQMDDLQFQLKQLVSKMSAIEPSNMASEKEEMPPPHY